MATTFPLLLLELNEIPWRMIDLYARDERFPAIKKFFAQSSNRTTITVDSGELSPWVTWPSLHRGLSNEEHGIKNLGQDPATFKGVPVWEEFRRKGLSVAVCGSLQSWPPQDPGPGGFYIPDTFAHDASCLPHKFESFQKFNLGLVRENGRVVRSSTGKLQDLLSFLISLPRLGIKPKTIVRVVKQVIGERKDASLLSRRPIFQSILLWDIFQAHYHADRPPALATFFTNHVASVMHRYWNHVFPEDFPGEKKENLVHRSTMDFAMGLVDEMLATAMAYVQRNPKIKVVVASSMGQAAVHNENNHGHELVFSRLDRLLGIFGFDRREWEPLLAMVPQVSLRMPDAGKRRELVQLCEQVQTLKGRTLFKADEKGESVTLTLRHPPFEEAQLGQVKLKTLQGDFKTFSFQDTGFDLVKTDIGTAYHIPEGILAVYGKDVPAQNSREALKASNVKHMIMDLAGL